MKKVLKWIGIILGLLVGLVVLAFGVVYAIAEARLNKTYTIQIENNRSSSKGVQC
jgi:predicted Co/Zn/Cd cation transporter (cation efflux family)